MLFHLWTMYGILVKLRFVPSQFLKRIVNARQEMRAKDVLCYAFIVMSNTNVLFKMT